jgi:hypothetical protein
MSGGAIVGVGALTMLPPPPEDTIPSSPVFATAQVTDLFPVPCKPLLWLNTLNTDRVCQTWHLPDREVERILSAELAQVVKPTRNRKAGSVAVDTRLTTGAMKVWTRTLRASDDKPRAARIARGDNVSRRNPPASRPADSNRRGMMIRPTSRQTMESAM